MIKKRMKVIASLIVAVLFGLTSCDAIGGDNIYDLDKAGEIEEIKKEIIEKVGDVSIYEMSLGSENELETSINDIAIISNDGASEGTLTRKDFQLKEDTEPIASVIDSEFSVRVYQKNDPLKLSELDFKLIEENFEAAKALIPSEYVDHALFEYTIEFDENKRADTFTVNTVLEGENNHLEGGDLVTNYYEFLFEMDETGAVVMLDQ